MPGIHTSGIYRDKTKINSLQEKHAICCIHFTKKVPEHYDRSRRKNNRTTIGDICYTMQLQTIATIIFQVCWSQWYQKSKIVSGSAFQLEIVCGIKLLINKFAIAKIGFNTHFFCMSSCSNSWICDKVPISSLLFKISWKNATQLRFLHFYEVRMLL